MTPKNTHTLGRKTALIRWLKTSNSPGARAFRWVYYGARHANVPVIPGLHIGLYHLHNKLVGLIFSFISKLYWVPLFRARMQGTGQHLLLVGTGMPLVTGPVAVHCGKHCRISTHVTISGRTSSTPPPRLEIGDNVGIGWQTTIACGTRVVLGNDVRIAGSALLAGYAGHPLNAEDRAAGKPDTDDQTGDIILENNVWLGTGVKVMAGVRIGENTVVAAGSIVTKDLPANVLAAGIPAKVMRSLEVGQ